MRGKHVIKNMRKRGLAGFATMGAAVLVLVGCGTAPEAGGEADAPETPEAGNSEGVDFLACAVSDEGSWNDKSFNEVSMRGLLKAESDLGVSIQDAESSTFEDFTPNLDAMVAAGCDVTFAVGFNIVEEVNQAALDNPDFNFVSIDGWKEDEATPNLKAMVWEMNESSFLAGYLSAAYSQSKTIGTYGGMNIPAVTDFMVGFYNGAKYYEKETGTEITVIGFDPANPDDGDYVGGFEDKGKAKSISEGQIEKGADVILPVAGGLFSATSEAINESGKDIVMLGVDLDVAKNSPQYADQILTSIEKTIDVSVFDVIAASIDGSFSGDPYVGTLENSGTRISPLYDFEDKVDADVMLKIEELTKMIIDGDIDPTVTP